jgi:uncharacterized protein
MNKMAVPTEGPFAGLKIIDVDSHYSEPHDLWTSRAPAKYKDLVPRVAVNARGVPEWYFDNKRLYEAGGHSFIDKNGHKSPMYKMESYASIAEGMRFEDIHEASYDASARIDLLDQLGIYAQCVYPNTLGFAAGYLVNCSDKELARTVIQIYNDAMAEWQEQGMGHLFPQSVVPFWDIDAAVQEAERVKGLGLRGVTLPGEPQLGGLPDLGQPVWEPLYEAMSDLELPINIHIGASKISSDKITSHWASQPARQTKPINAVQSELANSRFVANMLVSDLLIRYPKLKWVSVESGIGWLPYVFERIDYDYRERFPEYPDFPDPVLPPAAEMFRKGIYASFWFEKSGPTVLIDHIGADNIMWETDIPHPTCLYPDPVGRTAELMKDIEPAKIRKIMQDNAAALYKIDVS